MAGSRKSHPKSIQRLALRLAPSALITMACAMQSAQAFIIDSGNPDISMRWDTQFRYNAGWRMEKPNSDFANNPGYDAIEAFADRGDMVTNRVDLLTEFDLVFKDAYGFRVSAAAWRDFAYDTTAEGGAAATAEYDGGRYNSYARRFHRGLSGEVLDAFVFANFDYLTVPTRLKLGKHTLYWGEALYTTFHGISYSQGPLDGLKASTSPGIEAKEVFMPVNQFTGQMQLTPELSFAFQYMLDWKPTRVPAGGTYFSTDDMLRADWLEPGLIAFGRDVEPDDKKGQFGLALRWSPHWLQGTVGAYYRRFNETIPWGALRFDPSSPLFPFVPADVHFAYAEDTELYGLSLTKAIAGVSVGAELSYRKDAALNSDPAFIAVGDLRGVEGARGNTWHAVVNAMYMLPNTALWTGGNLTGELVYSRLDKVTKNKELFLGEGYQACDAAGLNKSDGCATKDFWHAQISFAPEYPQVLPGVNLTLPMSIGYGISGNAATVNGGNEGAYTWSVGATAMVRDRYEFSLKYNDAHTDYKRDRATGAISQNGTNAVQNDHGWLSFTFKTTF